MHFSAVTYHGGVYITSAWRFQQCTTTSIFVFP